MKEFTFDERQVKLLADAIWMRQRYFIVGDRRFKEYGSILEELLRDLDYAPTRS